MGRLDALHLEMKLEDVQQFLLGLLLRRVHVAIKTSYELAQDLLNAPLVQLMLLEALRCYLVELWAIEGLIDLDQLVFDPRQRVASGGIKLEDSVREYLMLLQSQSLHLSPGEALDDPALLLFLAALDLLDHDFSYKIVID